MGYDSNDFDDGSIERCPHCGGSGDVKPESREKTCKNCGQPAVKEWCEGWPDEVCEHWTPQKPKTHRDMLRSKSDEELAAWFRVIADCEGCPVTENFDECRHGKDCEDKWLEWLRKEVKAT